MASGKLAEEIYESLRLDVMRGELSPGARLGVRAIATRFGTSDLPVRQALWMLEREGFAVNVPFAGMSVRRYSAREIEEHYEIRGYLESMAMRLSPCDVPREQKAALRQLLADLRVALADQDTDRYGDLNQRFHMQLIATCPNGRLKELIESFWNGQRAYRSLFYFDVANAKKSYAEHRAIATAYLRGDIDTAADLLVQHRHRVADSVVEAMGAPDPADEALG